MARPLTITAPTVSQIEQVFAKHKLVKLREPVLRAFIVGSFAKGLQTDRSDIDFVLEVPDTGETVDQLEWRYRKLLQDYFVQHNIRGVADDVHPQWAGRRCDLFFTYDADAETRPKVELLHDRPAEMPPLLPLRNFDNGTRETDTADDALPTERPRG